MKEYKTLHELIGILQSRGLIIDDPRDAEAFLSGVNYYRFTGYALPFLTDREHYKPGSTFGKIQAIYTFDRQLRDLFAEALEVIELTFRTVMAREVARKIGAAGYLDPDNYRDEDSYNEAIDPVWADYEQSEERCVQHFKRQDEVPPIWAIVEVASFGHLSRLFKALKNEYRDPVSKLYGFDSSKFMCSLLQHLCVLRNRCAHHSRIYDLPWGQRDEAKDVSADPNVASRRRQLYIFPEHKEWSKLKAIGVRVHPYRPAFYQAALLYRFLKYTPANVFDVADWKKRAADLLLAAPGAPEVGLNLKGLLGVPPNPLTSPFW